MKNMKKHHWIMLVVAVQLAALASVAIKREWILGNGETVYLRTAPVDPRDLFRGDYVQLEYEIAQPDATLLPGKWQQPDTLHKQPYQQVYLQLERDARGIGYLTGIRQDMPDGLFIKGHFDPNRNSWQSNSFIKLGIEKYFVEQGAGLALEEQRGHGQDWQTPLEMEVALGSDGTAVIRGYRWSDLGIRLEVLEPGINTNNTGTSTDASTEELPQRHSPKLRISLRNQSEKPVIIVDSVDHCAFLLVENQFQPIGSGQTYQAVPTPGRPCNGTVEWLDHSIAPRENYSVEIDLSEAQWQVEADGKLQEIGLLQNRWAGFRWIYQLPESERKNRAQRTGTWLSTLRTARFNASGRID